MEPEKLSFTGKLKGHITQGIWKVARVIGEGISSVQRLWVLNL